MKVLIVGQNPSRMNFDPEVPFVGTKSYKTLLDWIKYLDIKEFDTVNVCEEYTIPTSFKALMNQTQHVISYIGKYKPDNIIALGSVAHRVLDELGVKHYTLPHPSPRNRSLNDKTAIIEKLDRCKKYLGSQNTATNKDSNQI